MVVNSSTVKFACWPARRLALLRRDTADTASYFSYRPHTGGAGGRAQSRAQTDQTGNVQHPALIPQKWSRFVLGLGLEWAQSLARWSSSMQTQSRDPKVWWLNGKSYYALSMWIFSDHRHLSLNKASDKGPSSQSYGFSRVIYGCWQLEHKESWVPKNQCFWTVVLEKALESPLDCKEIKPANPKGNQSWIIIGRTAAEALNLWPPDAKNWLTGKDPSAGKDWRQEEKGTTENGKVGWHYQLNGHEFEQAPGDGGGQGSLACCSPCSCKESNTTQQLNWTEKTEGLR